MIEALGAENILILDLAGQQIAARVDRRFLPEVGDEIVLHLDVDSIHLFDAETEMAFARPDPESLRA